MCLWNTLKHLFLNGRQQVDTAATAAAIRACKYYEISIFQNIINLCVK
jgi:hypothetical protein